MTRRPSSKQLKKIKPSDLPATRGMLQATRRELKAEISSTRNEMRSGFHQVKFEIGRVESKINKIMESVAQMQLANEQQRADNKVVFEALEAMVQHQDRFDGDIQEIRQTFASLAQTKRAPSRSQ